MKKQLFILIAIIATGISLPSFTTLYKPEVANFVPKGKWYKYTTDNGLASISFPVEPKVEVSDNESAVTTKVSLTDNDVTYFFGYTKHTVELDDPKSLAKVSLDAFVETLMGTVTSETSYSYKKSEGYQADIKMEAQGAYIKYKVIIIGQVQYQLVVINTSSVFGADAEKFFSSFKVK